MHRIAKEKKMSRTIEEHAKEAKRMREKEQ